MTLERPDSGSIELDGSCLWPDFAGQARPLSVDEQAAQDDLRHRIGMVFQHFNLFPHLTVQDNVALAPVLVDGKSRCDAASDANDLLQRVGLAGRAHAYPSELSGGQKQRVAIARALAMQPEIMLFDEATSALDPELVGEVVAVIQQLASESAMTMLFVTHQLQFVQLVATRVVVLDGGKIVEDGPPSAVLQAPQHRRTERSLAALSGQGINENPGN